LEFATSAKLLRLIGDVGEQYGSERAMELCGSEAEEGGLKGVEV